MPGPVFSALFALLCMIVSIVLFLWTRRIEARTSHAYATVKATQQTRIVVDGVDGSTWSATLAEILDAPTPHLIAPMPGALVVITTDPDRKTS